MKQLKVMEDFERIITLLKENPQGLTTVELYEELCIVDTNYRSVSTKTILNRIDDLVLGKIHDVEVERGARRCPHRLIVDRRMDPALSVSTAQLIGEEQAFLRLALQSISDLPELSNRHCRAIEKRFKLDALNTPYFIESQEAETLNTKDADTAFLIEAIKGDHPVLFRYTDESSQSSYYVEPYKLIVFDALWYLFAKDLDEKESSPYKTWRLKYIEDVDVNRENRHNTKDTVIEKILEKASDADFVVEDMNEAKVCSVPVKVWVDNCIADEVRLPGFEERVQDTQKRGWYITCNVSTTEEIDKDIKQWLPHIKILAPATYKETFEKEMSEYAEQIN